MTSTYTTRPGAERAAKRALGAEALRGVDFYVSRVGPAFTWAALVPVEERRLSPAHAAELRKAKRGTLPRPPDFSAPTHGPYRKKLAEVVAMAKAGDLEALRLFPLNPVSTSPRAVELYRAMAVVALEARGRREATKRPATPEARAS